MGKEVLCIHFLNMSQLDFKEQNICLYHIHNADFSMSYIMTHLISISI